MAFAFRSAFVLIGAVGFATAAGAQGANSRLEQITALFADASVVTPPQVVDCTLSGGTQTRCFSITVKPEPQDYTPGPWCPRSTSDSPEQGGIWLEGGKVYDVDGAFIKNLSTFYKDTNWQLFDPDTGDIKFTGTLEACQAAARPNVAPEYQNYCVECLPEYMPDDASMTYVIPLEPTERGNEFPTNFSGSGLAFNGVRLDGPAPVDAILGAYTLAPFDDCGGHVNTHVGYHYHAVTECVETSAARAGGTPDAQTENHGMHIGIAMDGHMIFPHLLADGAHPAGLDSCNGHVEDAGGYHYHAGEAGSNAILACLSAEAGCASTEPGAVCDATKRPRRP